ncbi:MULTISPECIES: transposase [Thermoanaerobacteraceae]|uniref:DDE family transposase n=2 Tax=Thermoanaerobacteraceae TaxID=186814 RepID=A0A4R2K553_9THEO|nr:MULTISPECIES: transposase [Thermoanaerobacteraceae]ABY92607.1 hypothetical protein Teth514_1315 [Thermoanaerobacter sp. X514]TCO66967.1 DDE family transposase [Caldanaerobacter subterraneus]
MKIKAKQLSLSDIYDDVQSFFEEDKPKFIKLFDSFVDLSELIPSSFYAHYYSHFGRHRDFSLESMLTALIIQKILSIPTVQLLAHVLKLSKELRELCGFKRVPHPSQFSRFKSIFLKDLENFFNNLVNLTEPICQAINPSLSNILIADTTGFEPYVRENNPKFFDSLYRNIKKFSKSNPDFDAHSYACSKMPKFAHSNPDAKFSYINGHYCYSIKATILTNGLGIIQHISFYDDDSLNVNTAKSAAESKDLYDSKTLIPSLKEFFNLHPNFSYRYFLGDAGFDSFDNYKYLFSKLGIIPIIPINPRNSKNLPQPTFNSDGIPTCPRDPSLKMSYDGIVREKGRATRIKWLCPMSKKVRLNGKTTYILQCDNPCTSSKCGRIFYTTLDIDFRKNTFVPRNSKKWSKLYEKRPIIEKSISLLKSSIAVDSFKLINTRSIKADVFLGAITQHIGLIITAKLGTFEHPLSLKKLLA